MLTTQLTLIRQAALNDTNAWSDLERLYRPMIMRWFSGEVKVAADVEDLTQEVFSTVVRELPDFDHNGRTGSFRRWLKTICLNRLLGYQRQLTVRGHATGGSDFRQRLEALEDVDHAAAHWEREHDLTVLRFLFERVAPEFEQKTLDIFRRLTLDGKTVKDVAGEFHIAAGAVYVARSRVLRRLREAAVQLLGDSLDQE